MFSNHAGSGAQRFAKRHDGMLFDRNECALVFQATFLVGGQLTRLIMSADAPYDVLSDLVDVTRYHKNDDRLLWDIFKLPHHCSYKSLNSEKGTTETTPVPNIKWLFEEQGQQRGVIISTSDPIPTEDTTQPPHFQAANYYRRIEREYDYEFKVTMEHPTVNHPEPLVIIIDEGGARVEKRSRTSSVLITSRQAPRAG
jgi:hypothetical protein